MEEKLLQKHRDSRLLVRIQSTERGSSMVEREKNTFLSKSSYSSLFLCGNEFLPL